MKFIVLNKNKFHYFLYFLVIYYLYYSYAEFKYISFIYSTPLNVFDKFNAEGLIIKSLSYLKSNLTLLKSLYVLKFLSVSLLLFNTTRRVSAIVLLLISLVLTTISSNSSPELRYLNLLLLIILLYPQNFDSNLDAPRFSPFFKFSLWLIFGVSYFIAGYFKFVSPDWFYGIFMTQFAQTNHNFNESFTWLLGYPFILKFSTFFAMWAELFALPLSLFNKTRFMALFNLTLMQMGLLFIADIYQITLGMLIFHLFLALTLTKK